MRTIVLLAALLLAGGCASVPREDAALRSSTSSAVTLAVADTCNLGIVYWTAVLNWMWLPVPIVYGVYTHIAWDNNKEDGTKQVLAGFACFALLPFYI